MNKLGRKVLVAGGVSARPYWIPAGHRVAIERFYADAEFRATFPCCDCGDRHDGECGEVAAMREP
jgi:hypothetical protein